WSTASSTIFVWRMSGWIDRPAQPVGLAAVNAVLAATMGGGLGDEVLSWCVRLSRTVAGDVRRRDGSGPEAGRRIENVAFRQPGQHVIARGSDSRCQPADDGRL